MRKKLAALFLALCAFATVGTFVACDNGGDATPDTGNPPVENPQPDPQPDPPPEDESGFTFEPTSTENGTAYQVSGIGDVTEADLVIPSTYKGCPVIGIRPNAFSGNTNVKSVTIPDSVNSIGERSFANCTGLTSVVLPDGLEYVYQNAFSGCSNLLSITLGTDLRTIGTDAFKDCYKLVEVINKSKLTLSQVNEQNGRVAYHAMDIITEAPFDSRITRDGEYYYYKQGENYHLVNYVGSATDLVLPARVFDQPYNVHAYAFQGIKSFNSVTVPDGVTVNRSAFPSCAVTELTAPIDAVICFDKASLKKVVMTSGETITASAFEGSSLLESVTIPESVTSLGNNAFKNCKALKEICFNAIDLQYTATSPFASAGANGEGITVTFGAKVTQIPDSLFYNCTSLTKVVFEENSVCKSIGENAFRGCAGLTEASLPYSVEEIGANAFSASAITSFVIPNLVTAVPSQAFYQCASLQSVTIGQSIQTLGANAFGECTALTEINFNAEEVLDCTATSRIFSNAGQGGEGITVRVGATVKQIPAYLFYHDTSTNLPKITALSFADDNLCASIGENAFYKAQITEVILPDCVQSIGHQAFSDNASLQRITLGKGLNNLSLRAFYGCTALTEINFNATNMQDLYQMRNYAFHRAGEKSDGVTVNIGANVTRIPRFLFYTHSSDSKYGPNLKKVVFAENSVCTIIDHSAFYGCTTLTSVNIPKSVETINDDAFYNCSGLTTATIEADGALTSIGKNAFYACAKLQSVTIPDGVTSIGENAFYDCYNLTGVYIPDMAKWYAVDFANVDANPLTNGHKLYVNGVEQTTLEIPATLTAVKNWTFNGWRGLKELTFEENSQLATIGESAFEGCTALGSVFLPKSIQTLGASAFKGCTSLEEVQFQTNSELVAIGEYAFSQCTSLSSVLLAEGLETIEKYAFESCTSLSSLTLPSSLTTIKKRAFDGCSKLKSVTFLGATTWQKITPSSGSSFSVDVSDAATNASNLTNYYRTYDWNK